MRLIAVATQGIIKHDASFPTDLFVTFFSLSQSNTRVSAGVSRLQFVSIAGGAAVGSAAVLRSQRGWKGQAKFSHRLLPSYLFLVVLSVGYCKCCIQQITTVFLLKQHFFSAHL